MKRRKLILLSLTGLGGVAGLHYLPALVRQTSSHSLTSDNDQPVQAQVVPNDDLLLRFAALGDVGTGQSDQYTVAQTLTAYWQVSSFPIVLMAGDNIYPNGEIERIAATFEQPYGNLLQSGVKFYASLGNHDFRTRYGEDQIAYPGYNMAARYYTFTQKTVQFFALDTNLAYVRTRSGESPWAAQLQWLNTELEKSVVPWKVVFAHHTLYSSGRHGSDLRLIYDLAPIFAEHGVQLYINGHDHHYERTQSIGGTTYITTGNGGARLRSVGQSDWTAFASSQLGFTVFEVYENTLVTKAIDIAGNVFDSNSITL